MKRPPKARRVVDGSSGPFCLYVLRRRRGGEMRGYLWGPTALPAILSILPTRLKKAFTLSSVSSRPLWAGLRVAAEAGAARATCSSGSGGKSGSSIGDVGEWNGGSPPLPLTNGTEGRLLSTDAPAHPRPESSRLPSLPPLTHLRAPGPFRQGHCVGEVGQVCRSRESGKVTSRGGRSSSKSVLDSTPRPASSS